MSQIVISLPQPEVIDNHIDTSFILSCSWSMKHAAFKCLSQFVYFIKLLNVDFDNLYLRTVSDFNKNYFIYLGKLKYIKHM